MSTAPAYADRPTQENAMSITPDQENTTMTQITAAATLVDNLETLAGASTGAALVARREATTEPQEALAAAERQLARYAMIVATMAIRFAQSEAEVSALRRAVADWRSP